MNTFSLTPRCIPVERKAPAAKREVDQDIVEREKSVSDVGSDAESGWSGVSDNSSTDSECTDIEASSFASDQNRFDTAYDAFRDLANDLYHIDLRQYSRGITSEDAAGVLLLDEQEKLQELVHLPRTWPLARLTIPLEGLSKQIDRLLEGYCFQILAWLPIGIQRHTKGGSYRRPHISLGSWLSTLQTLLRGSCEVFRAMILRSYLIKTLTASDTEVLGHQRSVQFPAEPCKHIVGLVCLMKLRSCELTQSRML